MHMEVVEVGKKIKVKIPQKINKRNVTCVLNYNNSTNKATTKKNDLPEKP